MLHSLLTEFLNSCVADSGSLALPMLLRFFVADEKLAIFSVPLRFSFRYLDDREDAVAFPENTVHFLQGAIRRFGVKEPNGGKEGGIAVYRPEFSCRLSGTRPLT